MSLRTLTERVYLLGGDAENVNVLSLASQYSPEGSANFRLSEIGTAETVNGYTELSSATATDTGGSDAKVTGLYHYRAHSGGSITRRQVMVIDDAVNEVEVWHSTDGGANWVFLKDLGAGAVGLVPSFLQVENSLTISFGGAVAVQEYDGSACDDAGQDQPAAPTVDPGGAGPLNGVYKYKIAEIDKDGTVTTVGPSSPASTAITLINKTGSLEDISNTGDQGARIFRTLGDGEIFFWVTDIVNPDNSHIDAFPDRDLLAKDAENVNIGTAPPTGARIGTAHRARSFYAGTNTYPNRLWWGDLGRSDSVGASNFLRIGEGEDGDEIVALWPEYEGELVIFKEQSIWRLSGDGRRTWNLDRTGASKGTLGKNSVAQVPAGAVFTDASGSQQVTGKPSVVYMTPTDIRLFDGMSDTVISWPKQDTFATMNYQFRDRSWCVRYAPYSWILFCFPAVGSNQPNTYVAWDYARGSWHSVDFLPKTLCAAVTETSTAKDILMIGEGRTTVGAIVYQAFTGAAAAGSNITAKFRTVPMTFQAPDKTKIFRAYDPVFGAQGSSLTATVNFYTGYADTGASAFSTHTVDMAATNANQVNPGPIYPKSTTGKYPRDEAHVVEITLAGQTAWKIFGWTTAYQVGPGWVR